MNLILFEPQETAAPLPLSDPRARHIVEILRRNIGDTFDVGLVDGPRGKAKLLHVDAKALTFSFTWGAMPPPLDPIQLVVGLPRPQTARKILQDATSLGVAQIHFAVTERTESSYAQSTLWSSGEWRRHLMSGAEQAFCTRLPAVSWAQPLPEILSHLDRSSNRIALDNYEAAIPLLSYSFSEDKQDRAQVVLAIGGERGWTNEERAALREHRFSLAHLGSRVLRTETAVVAGLAILKAKFGFI